MAISFDHKILANILDPIGECFTGKVAARIAGLRADARTQRRLDELAEKNSEGRLTRREEAEYQAYVEALDIIAILQAKARRVLRAVGRER